MKNLELPKKRYIFVTATESKKNFYKNLQIFYHDKHFK